MNSLIRLRDNQGNGGKLSNINVATVPANDVNVCVNVTRDALSNRVDYFARTYSSISDMTDDFL